MQNSLEGRTKARARTRAPATGDRVEQDLALRVDGGLQALLPLELQPMPPAGVDRKHTVADLKRRPRPSPLSMSLWDAPLLSAFLKLTGDAHPSPALLQRCIVCAVRVRKGTRNAMCQDTVECLEGDILNAIMLKDKIMSGQSETLLDTFDMPIELKPKRDYAEMGETFLPSETVWRKLRGQAAGNDEDPKRASVDEPEGHQARDHASEIDSEDDGASESGSEGDRAPGGVSGTGLEDDLAPDDPSLDTLAANLADVVIFEEAARVVEEDEESEDLSEIGDEDLASFETFPRSISRCRTPGAPAGRSCQDERGPHG
ncbi:hypothetical protein LTR53_015236 [Teratosphaeriaceae sp. CCFEE 6253]|nr:hypothetical protein LTR53_015236 [Teratosphaeriaceae sp. CCFEE 6253]